MPTINNWSVVMGRILQREGFYRYAAESRAGSFP
jgi:hypothetical protein